MGGNVSADSFNPDKFASNAERYLSEKTAPPVIGSLAGVVKIMGGSAQLITALAVGVLAGIPTALVTGNTSLLNHSWTHIKHGIGNIAAGIFEAIPGGGSFVWFLRNNINLEKDPNIHVELGQKDKFMPYESLKKEESVIVAGVSESNVHEKLAQHYYDTQSKGKNLSGEEKFALRKEAIRLTIPQLEEFKETGKISNLEHLDNKEDKVEKESKVDKILKQLLPQTTIKVSITNEQSQFYENVPTQFNFLFFKDHMLSGQNDKGEMLAIHVKAIESVEVVTKTNKVNFRGAQRMTDQESKNFDNEVNNMK